MLPRCHELLDNIKHHCELTKQQHAITLQQNTHHNLHCSKARLLIRCPNGKIVTGLSRFHRPKSVLLFFGHSHYLVRPSGLTMGFWSASELCDK